MSIRFCEKCLEQIVKNEVKKIRSMLSEEGNTYDFEPTQLELQDLYIDDEDDKNQFLAFSDKQKFKNWYYQVHGKSHSMFHPDAEANLIEVQNMLEECMDTIYSAGDGGYQIILDNTINNNIKINQIINKFVRKYINSKKNKSDYFIYLTIRPDFKKINFEEFQKKINKLFKMKCIKEFYYVYEQKYGSEQKDEKTDELKYNEIGDGFHIHALIKFNTNQNFGNANQQLVRSLKALKYYYKVDKYIGEQIWSDKMYYMGVLWESSEKYEENMNLDYKDDIDKNRCLEYDKSYRKTHNIKYLISSGSV